MKGNLQRLKATQQKAIEDTEAEISKLDQALYNKHVEPKDADLLRERLDAKLRRQREALTTTELRIKLDTPATDPRQQEIPTEEKTKKTRTA